MYFTFKYLIAYFLDIIIGDPHWIYHPVEIIGDFIKFLEKLLYPKKNKKFYGGLLAITIIFSVFSITFFLSKFLLIEIFLLYTTLATKSLGYEGRKILKFLKSGDILEARKKLSYLVSRDTDQMNEKDIIRSVVETISENTVDGVIAPIFYAMIGSFITINDINLALPFAMTYKSINTLDSMLGYKNGEYLHFGMISAKIDDVANFIPARISIISIGIASFLLGYDFKSSIKIFRRDRFNHSSPNSGHSEACFAGALGLKLGGKTSYFGKIYDKPTIGDKIKEFEIKDISKSIKLLYVSSWVTLTIFLFLRKIY